MCKKSIMRWLLLLFFSFSVEKTKISTVRHIFIQAIYLMMTFLLSFRTLGMSVSDAARELGVRWKQAPVELKTKYEQAATEKKQVYQIEMARYKHQTSTSSSPPETPQTPLTPHDYQTTFTSIPMQQTPSQIQFDPLDDIQDEHLGFDMLPTDTDDC